MGFMDMLTVVGAELLRDAEHDRAADSSRCRCGAPMYEDATHGKLAAASGFSQRRFYCLLDGRDVFAPRFRRAAVRQTYRRRALAEDVGIPDDTETLGR